jgi:hypothetical protein
MKCTMKLFKSLFVVILFITLFSALFSHCWVSKILSPGPRKARHEIPVTFNVGWWPEQGELQIDSFSVKIVESHLSMFNAKSLISYTVTGTLTYKGGWKPYIKEVQVSERVISSDTLNKSEVEILLTPIVGEKEDKSGQGGIENFAFTNEHILNSIHWGANKVNFRCGRFNQSIILNQAK